MFLFLLCSLPLLFSIVILLPWGRGQAPRTLTLVSLYLKGALLFFPGYLAVIIVRGICGFSYDGFLLYLSLLMRDNLAPLMAGLAGFLLLQRSLHFSGTDEGIFLTALSCLCGFLSIMNVADFLREWGGWDGYVLFVLPFLRVAAALFLAMAAPKFYRWEGSAGWLFCAVGAGAALVLTAAGYCAVINRPWLASALTALPVAGAGVLFSMRFPRVVRA